MAYPALFRVSLTGDTDLFPLFWGFFFSRGVCTRVLLRVIPGILASNFWLSGLSFWEYSQVLSITVAAFLGVHAGIRCYRYTGRYHDIFSFFRHVLFWGYARVLSITGVYWPILGPFFWLPELLFLGVHAGTGYFSVIDCVRARGIYIYYIYCVY